MRVRFYKWVLGFANRGLSRSHGLKSPADAVWWWDSGSGRLSVCGASDLAEWARIRWNLRRLNDMTVDEIYAERIKRSSERS